MTSKEQLLKLDNNNEYVVSYLNNCSERIVFQEINTKLRNPNDPLRVDPTEYNAIKRWQTSGLSLADALRQDFNLTQFERVKIFQNLSFDLKPLDDKYANLQLPKPQSAAGGIQKAGPTGGCCCTAVEISNSYIVNPIDELHPGGDVLGQTVPFSRDPDRGRQRVQTFGYFEGPSRYQDMQARGHVNRATLGEYFHNFGEGDFGDIGFIGEQRQVSNDIPVNFTATQQWNWVCRDSRNTRVDCGCERELAFSWDYESIISTEADLRTNRTNALARASVVDAAAVQFFEDRNIAGTLQVPSLLLNAAASECATSRWQGPGFDDVLDFAANSLLLAAGIEEISDDSGSVVDALNLISNSLGAIGDDLDDLLDQDWVERTACGSTTNQRQTMSGNLFIGSNNTLDVRLRPNRPVTLSLGVGAQLQTAGRRKYFARATASSSYRLASFMQPGGNPTNSIVDDCCSPSIWSWLLGTAADRGSFRTSEYTAIHEGKTA